MIDSSKILASLPVDFRDPLMKHYREIGINFIERRWEPSELNGGKFCEAAFSIVEGSVAGKFPAKPAKPKDMVQACRSLEVVPADPKRTGDRSLRILIPRILLPLYEIRNNRGVGHIGGDVDPNFLDATAVFGMASWVLAELIRIFHAVSIQEAQETVDAIIERKIPLVWRIGDVHRVLDPEMSTSDQVLLLLYAQPSWVADKDITAWVEYSSASMFRKRVLEPLHKDRFIEYDRGSLRVHISPRGLSKVENQILRGRAS